jgi:hypothetical protein
MSGHTVEDRGYKTLCWIAEKPPQKNGYVVHRWSWNGETSTRIGAHRLAYIRAKGAIPKGHHIDHLCRVTNCINPDHLEAVTPGENVRRSRRTKLTRDQVKKIRAADGTGVEIARQFGISPALVSLIRRRKVWCDVE